MPNEANALMHHPIIVALLEYKVGITLHTSLLGLWRSYSFALLTGAPPMVLFQVILSSFIKYFIFHDTGAEIEHIWSNTLQPKVVGEEGVNLPVRVTLADH